MRVRAGGHPGGGRWQGAGLPARALQGWKSAWRVACQVTRSMLAPCLLWPPCPPSLPLPPQHSPVLSFPPGLPSTMARVTSAPGASPVAFTAHSASVVAASSHMLPSAAPPAAPASVAAVKVLRWAGLAKRGEGGADEGGGPPRRLLGAPVPGTGVAAVASPPQGRSQARCRRAGASDQAARSEHDLSALLGRSGQKRKAANIVLASRPAMLTARRWLPRTAPARSSGRPSWRQLPAVVVWGMDRAAGGVALAARAARTTR